MDVAEETKSLTRRVKKIEISDQDSSGDKEIQRAFFEHFIPTSTNYFQICPGKRKSNQRQVTIHSDTFINQTFILCGLNNDQLSIFDISQQLSSEAIELPPKSAACIHPGLSSIRCSKVNSNVFYSSSIEDEKINLWDGRIKSSKPAQSFSTTDSVAVPSSHKKPILAFDVSPNDQFICAGTELVEEDSYLLFWDLRSNKLMGAYWESHSDDITAVKFHHTKPNLLTSGSTDGLVNVYNLLEPTEDDALLFSFNTESSVEKVTWSVESKPSSSDRIICITHTNEMKMWDADTGDPVVHFNRSVIATAMKRTNPDAVHLNGCYVTSKRNENIGLLTCSLSGDCVRYLQVTENNELKPRAIFLDETSVIQTAEYLPRENRWVTFDEKGLIKIWSLDSSRKISESTRPVVKHSQPVITATPGKRSKRFKPYSIDNVN